MPLALGEGQHGGMGVDCELHPLIHTCLGSIQAQDVEKKKAELKTPNFLSINKDVVANSEFGFLRNCDLPTRARFLKEIGIVSQY